MEPSYCALCKRGNNEILVQYDCRHHLCYSCIFKKIISCQTLLFQTLFTDKHISLICDKCYNGHMSFTISEIHEIVHRLNQPKPNPLCKVHNKEVELFCEECHKPLCSTCIFHHKELLGYDPSHLFTKDFEYDVTICDDHEDNKTQVYCLTCRSCKCILCIPQHKDHNIIPMREYKKQLKEKIREVSINYNHQLFMKQIESLETFQIQQFDENYTTFIREIDTIIEKLTKIKQIYTDQIKKISSDFLKINEIIKNIHEKLFSDLRTIEDWNDINYLEILSQIKYAYTSSQIIFLWKNNKFFSLNFGIERISQCLEKQDNICTATYFFANFSGDFCDEEAILRSNKEENISCLLSLNGEQIITGSKDTTIKIWDISNAFTCLSVLKGHEKSIESLLLLSDLRIVSGSADCTIRVWDSQSHFCCENNLQGHVGPVVHLAHLGRGNIGSSSWDGTIRIWDSQNYFTLKTILDGHSTSVFLFFSLNERKVLSLSKDLSAVLWDIEHNTSVKRKNVISEEQVGTSIAVLRSDKCFLTGYENAIRVWEIQDNQLTEDFMFETKQIPAHEAAICLLASISNSLIASSSYDYSIKIWEITNFTCKFCIRDYGFITMLITLPDGRICFTSGNDVIFLR